MGSDGYEKTFYAAFGKLLAEMRRKRGISQEMLADELGLSRTSITNIEKGRQPVQLHTLYLIARLLSIDIKELLPSQKTMDLPNEVGEVSVSRSEWLEQMNVKLPGGPDAREEKEFRRRSKKAVAD
ncbi:MAG: helix-turn-helix domain-containing protein [Acidobacteriia bacterium]|jgi:transcriptional regulator with XRE-family HTH domain|nr:helix-turn-helix domain-containing protein [Terriglobia bacterium]